MAQKVIITNSEKEINEYLIDGWSVKIIIPQHVALTSSTYHRVEGNFCFLLEKSSWDE